MPHRLDHLDRADRIVRAIVDVTVVLQAQIGPLLYAVRLHAGLGKRQLLGGQGHARDVRTKFGGGRFGQSAPAATNFEQAVTRLSVDHAQGAAHLGFLGIGHGLRFVAVEPGRRVVHRAVQPQLVKSVAQVVMRVDVLAAVAAVVAIEQVLDTVDQPPQPVAVNRALDLRAVGDQQAQQTCQIGRVPVARHVAFGKADIARLEHLGADRPAVDVQGRKRGLVRAKHLKIAIGRMQGERADFQAGEQAQQTGSGFGQTGVRNLRCGAGSTQGSGRVGGLHRGGHPVGPGFIGSQNRGAARACARTVLFSATARVRASGCAPPHPV